MRSIKQLLWWMIAGSEGGLNRARIINQLQDQPSNANQLAEILKLDYKTIRHHIDVLEKNNLITSMGKKYGKMYFLSTILEENLDVFTEIWERIGKNDLIKKNNKEVRR
ncbi:MAG: winged helix-turn-helix transcriptional regulator [Thermoplasmata archaeon]|nr:winged helix-turn-helix transcriptional regulator [Thermoplasmata archaeon]MCK5397603.1 winged helix-turn-helix transcriptional regulator [Thermoplasmata archaeon]